MYNKKSLKAEEFIDNQEILRTLEYAEKNKTMIQNDDTIIMEELEFEQLIKDVKEEFGSGFIKSYRNGKVRFNC